MPIGIEGILYCDVTCHDIASATVIALSDYEELLLWLSTVKNKDLVSILNASLSASYPSYTCET